MIFVTRERFGEGAENPVSRYLCLANVIVT